MNNRSFYQPTFCPRNFADDTDLYKQTQYLAYRRGLTSIYSYGESRIGSKFDATIFYSLQLICLENFVGRVITKEQVDEAEERCFKRFGTRNYFHREMFDYIIKNYDGKLPVRIKAVKEGTLVPINNVLFTIESLDEKCIPLVQRMETLLMHVWAGTTIATNSFNIKRDIKKHLDLTSTNPWILEYMCHDFGMRACTHWSHAGVVGSAHLISFLGSDTAVADRFAEFYYGTTSTLIESVWASEHAVALQFGAGEGEYDYVKACLAAAAPDKICSIVIDTFDDRNFIDTVVTRQDIKDLVLARPGKTVWRQDSGDAIENTNRNLNSLANSYGYSHNDKHYKILCPKIGLLQGDGITRETGNDLRESIIVNKWSADQIPVGSGSGLLVKNMERDTQKFAIKSSEYEIDDQVLNVSKSPKGQADKASKPGRLKLHHAGQHFSTISSAKETPQQFACYQDSLETVFENGEMIRMQSFDEIKQIANSYL